jgi:hypothetical protein
MDGDVGERELETLSDLARLPGLEAFSGAAVYTTTFEARSAGAVVLDLGEVRETSEVTLNGEPLGVRWYGRHRYDLAGRLEPGGNDLEITVTTLAFNHYRAQGDDPMVQHWMSRSRQEGPLPSGLLGPVRLLQRGPAPEGVSR